MHYPDLPALIADKKQALTKGPLALVLIEDSVEVQSTIDHLLKVGFAQVIAFGAEDVLASLAEDPRMIRVRFNVIADDALTTIINAMIKAAPNRWIHYCYNAEYLYYPFCEDRSIGEMINFNIEERRDVVMTFVVDLYADDLTVAPDAVSSADAHFDQTGYYALAHTDRSGHVLERQMAVYGGLRWRFEEHVPYQRRRIDRPSLFRATPGLELLPDHRFNIPEYNTIFCPWHNNITAAVCSFRTAKALKSNPGSGQNITSFQWQNSVRFDWRSQQLCDLGLMEPGQWF